MSHIRKVVGIGNSIGVVLPVKMLRELGIGQGDFCKIEMPDASSLLITKFDAANAPSKALQTLFDLREKQNARPN